MASTIAAATAVRSRPVSSPVKHEEEGEFFSSEAGEESSFEEEEEEEEDEEEEEEEQGAELGAARPKGARWWRWFPLRRYLSPLNLLLLFLSAALLLLGGALVVSEWMRYEQARLACASTFEVHADFSDKAICEDPRRDRYEHHSLLDCTKAERYVAAEPVHLCAIRSWAQTSLVAQVMVNASTKFDSATAPWILVAVCSLAILLGIRAWISEKGKTERAALQYEYMGDVQQSQGRMLFEAMPRLLEQQQQQKGAAGSTPWSPVKEDPYYDAPSDGWSTKRRVVDMDGQ